MGSYWHAGNSVVVYQITAASHEDYISAPRQHILQGLRASRLADGHVRTGGTVSATQAPYRLPNRQAGFVRCHAETRRACSTPVTLKSCPCWAEISPKDWRNCGRLRWAPEPGGRRGLCRDRFPHYAAARA